jgi:hypothetical protein
VLTGFSIALEIPIQSSHARSRGLQKAGGYLRVSCQRDQRAEFLERMGNALRALATPARRIYVQAINPFRPLELWEGEGEKASQILLPLDALRVGEDDSIAETLTRWEAEAHVLLFFASDDEAKHGFESIRRSERKWWRFRAGLLEKLYLDEVPRSDPVVFFANSHMSFEIFGSAAAVWSALDQIRRELAVHPAGASHR